MLEARKPRATFKPRAFGIGMNMIISLPVLWDASSLVATRDENYSSGLLGTRIACPRSRATTWSQATVETYVRGRSNGDIANLQKVLLVSEECVVRASHQLALPKSSPVVNVAQLGSR